MHTGCRAGGAAGSGSGWPPKVTADDCHNPLLFHSGTQGMPAAQDRLPAAHLLPQAAPGISFGERRGRQRQEQREGRGGGWEALHGV